MKPNCKFQLNELVKDIRNNEIGKVEEIVWVKDAIPPILPYWSITVGFSDGSGLTADEKCFEKIST